MRPKTDNNLERQLFALVALLGIDEAIGILTRERERVVAALNGDRAALLSMTVVDFCETLGLPKDPPRKVRALPAPKRSDNMHDVLADTLKKGPRPVRDLVSACHRRGVVSDESAESRRQVIAVLHNDKTFARTRVGGVYAIRTRAA